MKIRSVVKFRSLESFCDPDSWLRLLAQHPLRPSSPLREQALTLGTKKPLARFFPCAQERT